MRAKVSKHRDLHSLSHFTFIYSLTYLLSLTCSSVSTLKAIVSVAESGVTLHQQLTAVRDVAGTLQKQGFRGQAIALAIRAIAGAPDALLGKPNASLSPDPSPAS